MHHNSQILEVSPAPKAIDRMAAAVFRACARLQFYLGHPLTALTIVFVPVLLQRMGVGGRCQLP